MATTRQMSARGIRVPIDDRALVDHHCHGVISHDLTADRLERWISESYLPAAGGCSYWDTPLGALIRAHCAPLLDLDPFVPPVRYVERRLELGFEEVNRRLVGASGVRAFLIDTGIREPALCGVQWFQSAVPRAVVREVVRLERIVEEMVSAGVDANDYPDAVGIAVERALRGAAAAKTVVAYRWGLELEPSAPSQGDVIDAASRWVATRPQQWRLTDPVLLRHLVWVGIEAVRERRIPMQVHSGFGDPDLTLHRTDPSLLTPLLRATQPLGVAIMLLHCYPYHRQAGYLAAMFPHVYVDVGLALNHAGPSAPRVLAELMELAPFHKQLYSSDAVGLAELHYLGARLFRRSLAQVLEGWLTHGDIDADGAERIAMQLGWRNAQRVYDLNLEA
jgi:predicted TIM-barrel fold metal-dependent hydrolase